MGFSIGDNIEVIHIISHRPRLEVLRPPKYISLHFRLEGSTFLSLNDLLVILESHNVRIQVIPRPGLQIVVIFVHIPLLPGAKHAKTLRTIGHPLR